MKVSDLIRIISEIKEKIGSKEFSMKNGALDTYLKCLRKNGIYFPRNRNGNFSNEGYEQDNNLFILSKHKLRKVRTTKEKFSIKINLIIEKFTKTRYH